MLEHLLRRLVDRLRVAVGPSPADAPTDGVLVDRYLRDRDQAAFELLVRRHGPLVLGVCRRVLRNAHDAEDAFQATFLIFSRKMRSVRQQRTVAGWLYRVALRVALRARRGTRPQPLVEEPAVEEPDLLAWRDLRPVLDEELGRLPERLRLPVLLCYVEGHTTGQAAQLLGCPRGTVLSRLSTARKRLSARLTRRGVGLSVAGAAVALGERSVSAALVATTVRSAFFFQAGESAPVAAASAAAIHLAQGVLQAMFLSKISWAVGTVCVLAVLTLATGRVVSDAPTDARVRPQAAPAPAEQPKGEEKTVHLDRAKDELLVQEKRLHEIETMFSQELTDARAQLLELTEKLRAAERKRDMDVAVLQRRREQLEHSTPAIVDLREKINSLTRKIQALEAKDAKPDLDLLEKLHDALSKHRSDLVKELRSAEELLDRSRDEVEAKHSESSLNLRKQIMKVEETIRLSERRSDRGIARGVAALESATERVRLLEGLPTAPEPPRRSSAEIERKLDELLREVADIKKELKRLREGK